MYLADRQVTFKDRWSYKVSLLKGVFLKAHKKCETGPM